MTLSLSFSSDGTRVIQNDMRVTNAWLIVFFVSVLIVWINSSSPDDARYLVYTSGGGVYKFIIGFGVPVQVPMSLIFAHNFQFQYQAIDNATKFDELAQTALLRSLEFKKHQLYSYLHSFMERNNEDPSCLLKFICEVGEAPIDRSGLVGELLQVLFTPDEDEDSEFLYAWKNGSLQMGCHNFLCPKGYGFMDQFSYLI